MVAWRDDVAQPIAGFGADFARGALFPRLSRVRPDGPAADAGLEDGDLVVGVDGASVTELSPEGVRILIANRPPGEAVNLRVDRAGQQISAEVTLGPTPTPN